MTIQLTVFCSRIKYFNFNSHSIFSREPKQFSFKNMKTLFHFHFLMETHNTLFPSKSQSLYLLLYLFIFGLTVLLFKNAEHIFFLASSFKIIRSPHLLLISPSSATPISFSKTQLWFCLRF